MEVQKVNFLSTTPSSTSFEDPFSGLLDAFIDIERQILADANISDAEKTLVEKLHLEEGSSSDEAEVKAALRTLVAEYGDSPYAYFYHTLNGLMFIVDDLDAAIAELNQAVRLNPDFSQAQFLLGLANIIKIGDGFSF